MEYKDILKAIDYVEDNITEKIDYEEVAKRAYVSSFHFQKVFSIMCDITLGEYIRWRRLSLAGAELIAGEKVIDVAFKYGYETPESFSRAFNKFHGVLPSKAKSCPLRFFPRLTLNFNFLGENIMNCNITKRSELMFVGFKKRFYGAPYGEERIKQENDFFCSTRAKQWLLIGASDNPAVDYSVVSNVGDDGYDYYIAYKLDKWARDNLFNMQITGVDLREWGLEILNVPKALCAVFSTEASANPINTYCELREHIMSKWLPSSDYMFSSAPEVVEYNWRLGKREDWKKDRHIKIYMPIERK